MKNIQRSFGRVLIGIGVLLAAGGIYGFMQADEFLATARVMISERRDDIESFPRPPEIIEIKEILKSDVVLSNVVREVKLDSEQTIQAGAPSEFKTAQAVIDLRSRLEVRQIPNTRIFEIRVTDNSPRRAAEYANALVADYRTKRFDRYRSNILAGIQELKKRHKLQEDLVAELEAELSRMREALKLPSPEPAKAELVTNYPVFYQAHKKLEDEKGLLTLLDRKITVEETDLQSQEKFSQIEIVEKAVPPTSPVRRPKLLGTVLLVAGLGACLGGLMPTRDAKRFLSPA